MYLTFDEFMAVSSKQDLAGDPSRVLGIIHHINSAAGSFRFSVSGEVDEYVTISSHDVENIRLLGSFTLDVLDIYLVEISFRLSANEIFKYFTSKLNGSTKQSLLGIDNGQALAGKATEIFRWAPPWTWSHCAKCQLEVNMFISVSVWGACAAAGVTGPGAIAVAQQLILAKYGAAAWEAVKGVIFSASASEVARVICRSIDKC
jgi:hypothetical protein